jgi:hypothetical protein
LGSSHRFLPGDPLLGWFFRVWSGFGVHVCKFATGRGEGLTQSSKWLHDTLGNRLSAGSPIKRNPHLQRGLSVLTALNCLVAITGSRAQIPKLPKNPSLLPLFP